MVFTRNVLRMLLVSALMLPASFAFADEVSINRLGPYIQMNGFSAQNNFDKDLGRITNGAAGSDEDGAGLNIRAGYQILSGLALEVMYEYATGLESDVRGLGNAFQVDTHSMLANIKLSLPFYSIQPYVIVGLGAQRQKADSSQPNPWVRDDRSWNFVGRPGVGIDFKLGQRWTVNFEAAGMLASSGYTSRLARDLDSLFYTSVGGGLRYTF